VNYVEYFCPYCGDVLNEQSDIDKQNDYYKESNSYSHWDETNINTEF
jgi:hypothetical protein